MIFLELFITFFIIGAFTFGGGYAMLSLIQNQVVTVHQWLTPEEFTDIVAISQMSPGPIGINSATSCGQRPWLAHRHICSGPPLLPAGAVDLHPLREIPEQPVFCLRPESHAAGDDRDDRRSRHCPDNPLQLHRLVELGPLRRSIRGPVFP